MLFSFVSFPIIFQSQDTLIIFSHFLSFSCPLLKAQSYKWCAAILLRWLLKYIDQILNKLHMFPDFRNKCGWATPEICLVIPFQLNRDCTVIGKDNISRSVDNEFQLMRCFDIYFALDWNWLNNWIKKPYKRQPWNTNSAVEISALVLISLRHRWKYINWIHTKYFEIE